MSSSQAAYRQVYVGGWINWSNGRISGATLTLSSRNGTLLVAVLALFVAWSGSQLWALACYVLHQWRSTPEPRDALHHQQQVLLRLGLNDASFLWQLVKTTWTWKRSKSLNIIPRQLSLMVFAMAHGAFILMASLLTSRLADSNGEVLLQSPICGWPDIRILQVAQEKLTALPGADAFYVDAVWFYGRARDYSRECYTQTALLDTPNCNSLVKSTVNSNTRFNDSCPFQDQICETPAITVDTGIIDSHQHLGMNAPRPNRIQFRKAMSCTVIPADRYYSSDWTSNSTSPMFPWDPSGSGGNVMFKYYHLGPQTILGQERPNTFWITNATTSYEQQYGTISMGSFIDDPVITAFRPIPELNRTDADVTLVALRNRAMYTNPVNDPFFKSTSHRADYSAKFFTSDLTAGVLGCVEQYQFCNGNAKCTALNALGPLTRQVVTSTLGYNAAQLTLFETMWRTAYNMRLFNILFMLKDDALLAKDSIYGEFGISTGLPDDQWQREIQNLHNISLSAMQQSVVGHASAPNLIIGSGVNATHSYDWVVQENATAQQRICQNQKIKAQGYYSFSILGLSLMLVGGFIVIALGSFAPSITSYWRRKASARIRHSSSRLSSCLERTRRSTYRTEEWDFSDALHLHKVALEGHGIAPWIETKDVPLPFDHQKVFQIPWLAGWPGKTFFIEDASVVF